MTFGHIGDARFSDFVEKFSNSFYIFIHYQSYSQIFQISCSVGQLKLHFSHLVNRTRIQFLAVVCTLNLDFLQFYPKRKINCLGSIFVTGLEKIQRRPPQDVDVLAVLIFGCSPGQRGRGPPRPVPRKPGSETTFFTDKALILWLPLQDSRSLFSLEIDPYIPSLKIVNFIILKNSCHQ